MPYSYENSNLASGSLKNMANKKQKMVHHTGLMMQHGEHLYTGNPRPQSSSGSATPHPYQNAITSQLPYMNYRKEAAPMQISQATETSVSMEKIERMQNFEENYEF